MLKHSTSLGTLFGRSVCPLFLATALVVAPGLAHAADIIIDFNTDETNGDAVAPYDNDPAAGDTLTVEEGVEMEIAEDGAGLLVDSADGVTIINNGSIETVGTRNNLGGSTSATRSGGFAHGIFLSNSSDALIINNGDILTDDYYVTGIRTQYTDDVVVINNGSIAMNGSDAYGIWTRRSDAVTVVNNGTINLGEESRVTGMLVSAHDPNAPANPLTGHLLVNNGLIQGKKTGFNSGIYGMILSGAYGGYTHIVDSEIYNNGTIYVEATYPPAGTISRGDVTGIGVSAHAVDTYNYGNIHVESTGRGVDLYGSGNTLFNYGSITVDGINQATTVPRASLWIVGIESFINRDLDGTNSTGSDYRNKIVNAGMIEVNDHVNSDLGAGVNPGNSAGIYVSGDSGHDIYNYGTIRAPNGWSLLLDADKDQGEGIFRMNNVYLFDGSILVGDINVNPLSRDEYTLYLGDGYNAALRFDSSQIGLYVNRRENGGPFPAYISSPNGYVLIDDMLITVDLESYSQQDEVTWSMVSLIQDAIDSGTETRVPSGDFAFNGDGKAGMSEKWAQMFAGWVHDPGDGAISIGDSTTDDRDGGFNGYSAGTIIGVNKPERSYFAGAAYSQVSSIEDMDNDTGYETYSGTLFGGIATTLRERFNLSLTAGVSFNHSERDMADNRVDSGMDSVTANYASVFLSPSLLVDGPWGSSLRLNYLGGLTQGHSYELSGGEKLEVEHRFNNVFGAKVQMTHNIPNVSETFPVRVRYGLEGNYADGQDIDSTVTLSGFTATGEGLSTPYDNGFTGGGFAGLDFGPAFIQAGYNTNEQVSVNAGLKIRF